ncbi:MAG: hypothetical protein KKA35_16800 [Proteobacteria bacterium]|nr:hypothetical protein [Pseudomonadota bacterium]
MIDKEVFNLYEIDGADLEQILREQGTPAGYFPVVEGFELIPEDMLLEAKEYIKSLQRIKLTPEKLNEMGEKLTELYEGGKTIEEIAVQMQINLVSVAAMRAELDIINSKDLKHEVENLLTHFILDQLKNDKDGIIPLYKDATEKTMERRLVEDIEKMFGEDKVSEILNEIKQILEKDLEGWLSSDFFKKHVSQYKKRPIIWHISSPEGYFEVLLYYHKLNNQTLHILKNVYLSKASDYNRRKLKELDSDLTNASDKNKGMIKEKEEREDAIDDIKSFETSLDEVLKQGIDPVIDDGVLANISQFQKAGLLAMGVLDKNQLKKGEELLAEYIEERRQNK